MENSFPHLFAYWAIYSNSKSCIKLENPTKIEEEIETKQKNPNQSNILCVTQEIYDSMAKFSKNLNFLNQSLNNSNIQIKTAQYEKENLNQSQDSKEFLKNRVRNNYYSHLKSIMLQKYSDQSKGKKIGLYTLEERMEKIIKFKLKQYKHREKFPTIRKFSGRSNVAKFKNRFKGKFIKQIPAEAQNKIKYNCEPASNDAVLFNL